MGFYGRLRIVLFWEKLVHDLGILSEHLGLVYGDKHLVPDDPLPIDHDVCDHLRACMNEQVVRNIGEGRGVDDGGDGMVGIEEEQVCTASYLDGPLDRKSVV